MISPLQRTLWIDQDIGDILHIADFPLTATNLQQRIVGGAGGVGRIEQQNAAEPDAPAGGQRPVFALDVVDDRRTRPGQQRRDDEADTFTGSGGGKAENMLWAIMAQIMVAPLAEQHAIVAEQSGLRTSAVSAHRAEP